MNYSSSSTKLCSSKTDIGSGDSFLLLDALPQNNTLFDKLNSEVEWHDMRHKSGRVPRDICIQGTVKTDCDEQYEPVYRHPADEQPALVPWTPTVLEIKEQIEKLIGQDLNHALIQRYRDGKDFIGEHSDKTLDILIHSNIVNYSIGATRVMILKHKTLPGVKQKHQLPHNSLLVMGWKTNREWLHAIKQDKRMDQEKRHDELIFEGQRISLTLRTIATFRNRSTGQLHGQGATKTKNAETSRENEENLLMAFSAENKLGMNFDWNKYYGCGFDTLNFKMFNQNLESDTQN